MLLLFPLSFPFSLRNAFLLNRTAVLLFTPAGGVDGADLSECTLVGVPGLEELPSCFSSKRRVNSYDNGCKV